MKHISSGDPSAPRVTGISVISASHGKGLHPDDESCYGKAGSGTESYDAAGPTAIIPTAWAPATMGPMLQAPQMVPPLCQPPPFSGSWPMTPYQQAVVPPSKPKEKGVTFDTSAGKPAATGSQDTNDRGRQCTRSWPNNIWPASQSRGGHAGSFARMTSTQTASQGSEHHSSAPYKASAASRLRSSSHPCPSSAKAPKDPLKFLACYQNQ